MSFLIYIVPIKKIKNFAVLSMNNMDNAQFK